MPTETIKQSEIMRNQNTSADVYQMVTDKIMEQMNQGIIPWHKPWIFNGLGAISYATGNPYSLINQFLLGRPGEYLTWNQIQEKKGHVKKGAKSQFVVFFKQVPFKEIEIDEEGEKHEVVKTYPVLRYYNVFHIEDCEGIQSRISTDEPVKALQPVDAAEAVVNGYFSRESCKLVVRESAEAYYSPGRDEVVVPEMAQYKIVEEYYSTLFHEMTHSTGHDSRLKRGLGTFASFGSENYSKEELVAEIGSAFLCQKVGFDCDKAFKNSVAYLQSWLRALKNDKKLIVSAASKAEKAVNFILGIA